MTYLVPADAGHWSFTGGHGYLKSAEALHPTGSMHRLTGSALHGMKPASEGQWASTLIWGANGHRGAGLTHAVLLESEAVLDCFNTIFGREECYASRTPLGALVFACDPFRKRTRAWRGCRTDSANNDWQ